MLSSRLQWVKRREICVGVATSSYIDDKDDNFIIIRMIVWLREDDRDRERRTMKRAREAGRVKGRGRRRGRGKTREREREQRREDRRWSRNV